MNPWLIVAGVLALLMLCLGCADWRSRAMVSLLNSPVAMSTSAWRGTWPLIVQPITPDPGHVEVLRALQAQPRVHYCPVDMWDLTLEPS
jgi:hypothetical protein